MCDCKAKLMGTGILFCLTAKFASKNSFLFVCSSSPFDAGWKSKQSQK